MVDVQQGHAAFFPEEDAYFVELDDEYTFGDWFMATLFQDMEELKRTVDRACSEYSTNYEIHNIIRSASVLGRK